MDHFGDLLSFEDLGALEGVGDLPPFDDIDELLMLSLSPSSTRTPYRSPSTKKNSMLDPKTVIASPELFGAINRLLGLDGTTLLPYLLLPVTSEKIPPFLTGLNFDRNFIPGCIWANTVGHRLSEWMGNTTHFFVESVFIAANAEGEIYPHPQWLVEAIEQSVFAEDLEETSMKLPFVFETEPQGLPLAEMAAEPQQGLPEPVEEKVDIEDSEAEVFIIEPLPKRAQCLCLKLVQ